MDKIITYICYYDALALQKRWCENKRRGRNIQDNYRTGKDAHIWTWKVSRSTTLLEYVWGPKLINTWPIRLTISDNGDVLMELAEGFECLQEYGQIRQGKHYRNCIKRFCPFTAALLVKEKPDFLIKCKTNSLLRIVTWFGFLCRKIPSIISILIQKLLNKRSLKMSHSFSQRTT